MRTFLVYLAGPIKGCTFGEATSWREIVMSKMPNYIQTMSPMRGKKHESLKGQLGSNGTIQTSYEEDPMTAAKGILTRDYNDCKRADMVFVNLLGAKTVSIGTVMEIAWAKAHNIPTVIAMEPDNIHNHAMINESVGFIVDSLEAAISVTISVLSTDIDPI